MKVTYHPLRRWCVVAVDARIVGYILAFDHKGALHLNHKAPDWLRAVEKISPFESMTACQNAINAASAAEHSEKETA